ncbi:MAG: 30S ribosomal protein S8 [Hyphomicrobiales bacterium]|nr:30S ribosomal protein S8 [Hyphomicrobiales bacterium]
MAVTDPIADMLATIRNGQQAKLAYTETPYSQLREQVLKVLEEEGYISGIEQVEIRKGIKRLKIKLKYFEGQGAIKEMKKISKPGRRVYKAIDDLQKFYNGLGISILSTSKGVMSDHRARQENVGGEVLCNVF